MKKITFVLLLLTTGIFSQTIQMPNIPEEGVIYQTKTLNSTFGIPPSDSWDFSDFELNNEVDVTMIPIENSSFSSSLYPNTTHVKSFLSGDEQVVQFPGFTSSGYTYNGENSIIINNYSTPLTIMPYPFSVGDTHSDAVYDISFTCPVCPDYMFRDHEISTQAIDSGTVTMPDGSVYENVVLIQHDAIFSDAQTGSAPCVTQRTSHFWWAEDLGIPLIETYFQSTSGACDFPSASFSRFYTGQQPYISGCPESYSLPYLNDFNDTESFNSCNTFVDSDGDGNGWTSVAFTIDDGNSVADSQSYNGSALTPDNWLIMGPIDMTNVNDATLSWKVRGIDPNWCGENYSVYVSDSNDIGSFTSSSLYYDETISSISDACGNTLADRTFDISSAAGQEIYVGFRHYDISDMFRLNIDDVAINSNSLSSNDYTDNNINYFYNQITRKLEISSTEIIKNIEIINLLGQKVISDDINNLIYNVDLANLSSSIYIVNIEGNSGFKTFKLQIN
jgi:hypothetical protein